MNSYFRPIWDNGLIGKSSLNLMFSNLWAKPNCYSSLMPFRRIWF